MRLVAILAVLGTMLLVAVSYMGEGSQLAGLMVALALGLASAALVMFHERFDRVPVRQILVLGALLRLLVLCGQPLLEDDYFRYLWDGWRFATAGTPYGAAPAAFFADPDVPARFQHVLSAINYPEIPTIYGPLQEYLFRAGYALAPGEVWPLQAANALIDLFVLLLLGRLGAAPRCLLLYAISPLVLKEAVMTAHPDGVMALLALAALAWVRYPWLKGLLLGCAAAAKLPALLLWPFLARRGGALALLSAPAGLVLCYLPFWLGSDSDLPALTTFAHAWRFNPLLFASVEGVTGPALARPVAAAAIGALLLALYRADLGKDAARPGQAPVDRAFGVVLLLAPVVNPWYMLWLLPFAVLRPSRIAWTASFVLPLSYCRGAAFGGAQFDIPVAITLVQLLALAVAGWRDFRSPLGLAVPPWRGAVAPA